MPTSASLEQQLAICIHNDAERAAVNAALQYIRDLEHANQVVSQQVSGFMEHHKERIAELVQVADYGMKILAHAKEAYLDGSADGWVMDALEFAADKQIGDVVASMSDGGQVTYRW